MKIVICFIAGVLCLGSIQAADPNQTETDKEKLKTGKGNQTQAGTYGRGQYGIRLNDSSSSASGKNKNKSKVTAGDTNNSGGNLNGHSTGALRNVSNNNGTALNQDKNNKNNLSSGGHPQAGTATGKIYAATQTGVFTENKKKKQLSSGNSPKTQQQIDMHGRLLIGTEGGIWNGKGKPNNVTGTGGGSSAQNQGKLIVGVDDVKVRVPLNPSKNRKPTKKNVTTNDEASSEKSNTLKGQNIPEN